MTVTMRAQAVAAFARFRQQVVPSLAIFDSLSKEQALQTTRAIGRIGPARQFAAAVQQHGVLLQRVIDDPIGKHAPWLADAAALEHESMPVPQMLDHVAPFELRLTARTRHANAIFQVAAELVQDRRLAEALLQLLQSLQGAMFARGADVRFQDLGGARAGDAARPQQAGDGLLARGGGNVLGREVRLDAVP